MPTDDEAREAGFLSAADMQHYIEAMREGQDVTHWIEAGAPSPMDMWRELDGVPHEDTRPLTIQQAADRENVSVKTIRRRLPALVAMEPPGAYRIGDGDRAPWRIIPAALDRGPATVAPEPVKPPRGPRRTPAPRKRSATRWEA
jgi:hypothetical protein